MMNPDVTPAWALEAERLFPDLLIRLSRDPDRRKSLDDVLAFFPRDSDKIAFLRYAHVQKIAPDDPTLFAMVQFLGMLLYLNENRLEPSTKNIVEAAERVADTLKTANGDMTKLTRMLVGQAQKTIEKSDGLVKTIESLATLVANLGSTLDTAASDRVKAYVTQLHELIEERVDHIVRVKASPLIDQTLREEAQAVVNTFADTKAKAAQLSEVVVQLRDALKPAVDAVNESTKLLPGIDRWVKIPRRDARIGGTAGILMLALGIALGYTAHQPRPNFTATPEVVRAMTMGADYLAIRDKLDPATRTKVDQAITKYIAP